MGRRPAQHAPPDVLVVGGVVGVATVDDIIDNGNAEECKLKGGLRSSGGGGGHKLQFEGNVWQRRCLGSCYTERWWLLVWLD